MYRVCIVLRMVLVVKMYRKCITLYCKNVLVIWATYVLPCIVLLYHCHVISLHCTCDCFYGFLFVLDFGHMIYFVHVSCDLFHTCIMWLTMWYLISAASSISHTHIPQSPLDCYGNQIPHVSHAQPALSPFPRSKSYFWIPR